jgi:hypothetical protein
LAESRSKVCFKTVSHLFQPTIISFEYHNICKGEIKMKTWKIITLVGIAVIMAALLTTSVFALGMMGGGRYGGFGGMMGGGYGTGYGYNNPPYTTGPSATTPSTQYYQPVYPFMFGGGMMGRLGNGYGFGGMMRGYGYSAPYANNGSPLSISNAATIAQNYVSSIGNPDLVVKQVKEYTANFYVLVNEKNTGNGAFELLINKYTGSIYPEMGPNMMWNTKYGMMRSGILGGIFGSPSGVLPVTVAQATTDAQQYLNTYLSGSTTGDITTFHGYYTVEVLTNGIPSGMLSINGYTGQVWVHTWHGTFIQELQVS